MVAVTILGIRRQVENCRTQRYRMHGMQNRIKNKNSSGIDANNDISINETVKNIQTKTKNKFNILYQDLRTKELERNAGINIQPAVAAL